MECFQYPIDTKILLRKKNSLKKELLKQKRNWIQKKIAVLGGSTTNELVSQLELFLLYYGIKAEFYQSEYAQYWQDAVFGNSILNDFHPDIIYIHTNWRNISLFPSPSNTLEEIETMFMNEYKRFEIMWESLTKKFQCPIIQNNFDRPNYRLMGNRDIWDKHGRSNYISCLNQEFYEYARKHISFYINDLDYLSSDFGLSAWEDSKYWHMYKYAMCLEAIPLVANNIATIIKSIYGYNKKVLALDLDNTLWGGVVGDDGVEGIAIGSEIPNGQVFLEFQNYCKDLKQVGIVLAVNSKNEKENALAGLNHPSGVLKPDDFVSIKANWESKDQNLIAIADELTLGTDSFVFADDNPAERTMIKAQLPGVAVPNLDRPENYINIIDHSGYFEVTVFSDEDLDKTKQYHAKAQAIKIQAAFEDYGQYLDSLEMKAVIREFESIYIQRITQLTNKTNQFNLTTLRYTENDIKKMCLDENYLCLYGKLLDKFGDNGVVSVVIGEQQEDYLHIRLWLMSCRVLKRGLEDAMMNVLVLKAKKRGIKSIIGYYYPTQKNSMVKQFYLDMGYSFISMDKEGNSTWNLVVDEYEPKKLHMRIEEQNKIL